MFSKLKNWVLFCNSLIYKYNFFFGVFFNLIIFYILIKYIVILMVCKSYRVY